MKQFIVLSAILPILLLFTAQFALDQRNGIAVSFIQERVYAAREKARQEGYFTEAIRQDLRAELAGFLGIDPLSIAIDATEEVQYRVNRFAGDGRGIIHYSVRVPIGEAMAGSAFLGLTEAENRRIVTVEGQAASEKLQAD